MTYRDFTPGIRFAITWLHKRANEMNDPKAKQVLDSAAFSLGVEHAHKRRGCTCDAQPGGHVVFDPSCPVHDFASSVHGDER
jgi:hypothetical protein